MTTTSDTLNYTIINQQLKLHAMGVSASELHGLITGLLSGGAQDQNRLTLLQDFVNDGLSFPISLFEVIQPLQQAILQQLSKGDFSFQLLLPDDDSDDLFSCADELAGWVNHFLLGFGLVQTQFNQLPEDIQEVIDDLRAIGQLGYDPEEEQSQLIRALVEITEYVRMAAILCFNQFGSQHQPPLSVIH